MNLEDIHLLLETAEMSEDWEKVRTAMNALYTDHIRKTGNGQQQVQAGSAEPHSLT